MSPLKPNEERFLEMVAARNEGLSGSEIAREFGVSRQRVSELFKKHGIALKVTITDEDIKRIGDADKIANTYNITINHARSRMRQLGLFISQRPGVKWSKWTRELVLPMHDEYMNGSSQKEIGIKYGIAQNTVSMLFKRYGLETNKRGWPDGKPRKYF